MRVTCVGGGPAGLYFAILIKRRFPAWQIRVVERNRPLDTFGWGVVFSDATLDNLRQADEPISPKHHRSVRALGRHRDSLRRTYDRLERPRILRHLAQAPSRDFAAARGRARRRADLQ